MKKPEINYKKYTTNLLTFCAGFAANAAAAAVLDKPAFKAVSEGLQQFLSEIPKFDDTPFSSFSKSSKAFSQVFLKEYAYQTRSHAIQHLTTSNPKNKVVSDRRFIGFFLPILEEHGIGNMQTIGPIGKSSESATSLIRISFAEDRNIYYFQTNTTWGSYTDETFISDFDYPSSVSYIFEHFGNAVFLGYNKEKGKFEVEKLRHETLKDSSIAYSPEKQEELMEEYKRYCDKNQQRSYLLLGEPGTGKTSVCLQIAGKISPSILKLDVTALRLAGSSLFDAIISFSKAKVIVIDDIDRLGEEEIPIGKLLYCLESVKAIEGTPLLLATANNISTLPKAAIRPGRFDRIIEFANPTPEDREVWFRRMQLPENYLEEFIKITDGYTQAFLKEIEKQLCCGTLPEKVLEDIKTRNRITNPSSETSKKDAPKKD